MAERREFTYDSRDGETKIHAVRWMPAADKMPDGKPCCIVQIIHGMQEYALRYDDFAQFLADQGMLVIANDHLGHGQSVREGNPFGYICEQDPATVMVRDVHRLKKITQEEYPGVPFILIGHSMGSFILRNYLTRYGTGIDGAIIIGTGWYTMMSMNLSQMIVKVIGAFKGSKYPTVFVEKIAFKKYLTHIEHPATEKDWISRDTEVVNKYIHDPLCSFVFTVNGFWALAELTKRSLDVKKMKQIPKKLPILIASGTEDPVGEWGNGPQQLYDTYLNLDLTKTQLKMYNGARHEILNEINREEVYRDLYNWIANILDRMN